MNLSDRQLLDALSRTPFVDSMELALVRGEPHATVHRNLVELLATRAVTEFALSWLGYMSPKATVPTFR